MYVAGIPPVPYTDPWQGLGFDERLGALLAGSPRIAYYYAAPDSSTFRYRVYNVIEALNAFEPDASAAWFSEFDGVAALQAVENADVLVLCRSRYSRGVASLLQRARALGTTVLFDVDDLVFDTRLTHLIMETLDEAIDEPQLDYWFSYISRIATTLRLCDGAITTNEFLAERLRDVHDVPIYIIPNFLNRSQITVSQRLMHLKSESQFSRDDFIHLGYFSGTPTHNRDFAIVEPAIAALMADDPRVRLRVVGFLDLSGPLTAYTDRIEFVPLQDFLNLQRLISEVEINVVPLQDNVFTNCKSELKYFEAAAVGTISVASPTFALRRAIRHAENGLLVRAQDWHAALRDVLAALDDTPAMAMAAASDALARYSPQAQLPAIRQALLEPR